MVDVNIILPRKNFDVIIKETFHNGITGIFGPSGAGKSSLLYSISGLDTPIDGKISIGSRIVFDISEKIDIPLEKRNIGYVFQEGRLFPHMSFENNLRYGVKKEETRKISFDEVVTLLDLKHILNSKPSQISGGERQRTALGRALLSSPDILLLDEPFSAVDGNLRRQILPFIIRIQRRVNIPILVVSHDFTDLLKLTNRLCLIDKGKCVAHGDYYDLLKNENISTFFASSTLVNSIEMNVVEVKGVIGSSVLSKTIEGKDVFIKYSGSVDKYKEGE